MIFGFNTDVPAKEGIYHVQTEDRGAKNPVIESIVYVGGKIMGRRRTPYTPEGVTQERIEEMVRRQHKELVEAIRTGTWIPAGDGQSTADVTPAQARGYLIQLLNPRELRHGEYLRFQLSVSEKGSNTPAAAVALEIRWLLGGNVVEKQSLLSLADGSAELWLPRPSDRRHGTLLVCAQGPGGRELAKFHARGFDEA